MLTEFQNYKETILITVKYCSGCMYIIGKVLAKDLQNIKEVNNIFWFKEEYLQGIIATVMQTASSPEGVSFLKNLYQKLYAISLTPTDDISLRKEYIKSKQYALPVEKKSAR